MEPQGLCLAGPSPLLSPLLPPLFLCSSDSEAGWGLPREEVVAEGLGTSPSHPQRGRQLC